MVPDAVFVCASHHILLSIPPYCDLSHEAVVIKCDFSLESGAVLPRKNNSVVIVRCMIYLIVALAMVLNSSIEE